MIRSLHKLLVARSEQDYRALLDFFDALGVARRESWLNSAAALQED
jgi:hypothetical protein